MTDILKLGFHVLCYREDWRYWSPESIIGKPASKSYKSLWRWLLPLILLDRFAAWLSFVTKPPFPQPVKLDWWTWVFTTVPQIGQNTALTFMDQLLTRAIYSKAKNPKIRQRAWLSISAEECAPIVWAAHSLVELLLLITAASHIIWLFFFPAI